ncbi:autotransporter secretion inner membrane protein TamB [Rhizobiales bacterium GAS113]|nr:autotransporter secretion inner membrane protein TamB [Rhizobiales bacterium GAS113]
MLFAAIVCLSLVIPSRADEADKGVLADLISRALSSETTTVSVGAVDGALSSSASISDIVLSDRDGPWLKIDRVRLVWRRLALVSRRLEVDQLLIHRLEFLRKPLPSDQPAPKADAGPILPELPVKVVIKEFAIGELVLGAPVIGVASRLSVSGAAVLGNPAEGLDLRLDAKRLDAEGALALRLQLVPDSKALTLALKLAEPEGGVLAHAASIPGLPAVTFDLDGKGTLDAFKAGLTFDAGPTIGATGGADLGRAGAGRRLGLNLQSRIEGLLPPVAGAIFAGTTELQGDITFADDGAVNVSRLAVASRNARLDIAGGLDTQRNLDMTIAAAAVPGGDAKTVAGGAEIRSLDFGATVKGPLAGPKIAAELKAADLRSPQAKLASLAASFTATPNAVVTDPASRVALVGDVKVAGLALADPALTEAMGSSLSMSLRGTASPEGAVHVEELRLTTPTLGASYAGLLGPKLVRGKLALDAAELRHFARLASLPLKGALGLTADLDGAPAERRLTAGLDAHVTNFASGIALADGLAGGKLVLAGSVKLLPRGGFGFGNLSLTGMHATARLDGEATPDKAAIAAVIDIPEAKSVDPRLAGKAMITAALTGSLAHPDASLKASLTDGKALDRPVPRLDLEAVARDLTGALEAQLTLAGEVDRKPLAGAAHIAKRPEGGVLADRLSFNLGSADLQGNASFDTNNLATGRLTFKATNLDDLSALLLTRLAGDLNVDATLDATNGRQNARLLAHGQTVAFGASRIEGLDADLAAADLRGRPTLDGTAAIGKAILGGETISGLRLKAKAVPEGSDVALAGNARGLAIEAQARLVPAEPYRIELASLRARGGAHKLALAAPATLSLGPDAIGIAGFVLGIDAGRLRLDGSAGATLSLKGSANAVPLSIADLAQPGLGLSGTADAEFAIAGTPQAPSGDWRVKIDRLVAPQARGSGLPPIDIAGSGRLADGRSSLDLTANAGRVGSLHLTGSAPLSPAGALDIAVQGKLDAAAANGFLAASGRRVSGAVQLDARLRGSTAQPQAEGSVSMSGGSFTDVELGLKLEKIEARIAAHGDTVTIEHVAAATPNGGTVGMSGQLRLDPEAGFPGTLRITGQRAQLVSNSIVAASADLALDLSGPLGREPAIGGRIGIVSMDVTLPDRLLGTMSPIEGTRHLNPSPTAKARLAMEARAKAHAKRKAAFNGKLNLVISAPNRIFVRGHGLDAELGGELKVTGMLADPQIVGGFDLRRGRLAVLGKRLDFTRGHIGFSGELMPELDFMADSQAGDVTAHIGITGPATQPVFAFSSDPSLPQDEVLSRILFQKPSGSLSPFQALQLAQAAAQFAGGGDDAFERLRRSLGVDSLDIGTSSSGSPTVGASRAISDRLSVGVKAGSKPQDSGVSVDLDVTRHIRLQSGVDATGATSVGVGAEWEYK